MNQILYLFLLGASCALAHYVLSPWLAYLMYALHRQKVFDRLKNAPTIESDAIYRDSWERSHAK
jgi:hypothetical protein